MKMDGNMYEYAVDSVLIDIEALTFKTEVVELINGISVAWRLLGNEKESLQLYENVFYKSLDEVIMNPETISFSFGEVKIDIQSPFYELSYLKNKNYYIFLLPCEGEELRFPCYFVWEYMNEYGEEGERKIEIHNYEELVENMNKFLCEVG